MLYWRKHGTKIARRNINNLGYADDTTLMAESKKKLGKLLMKVKGESEKAGLKLNIQKTKIMAFGPISSWQIDGETMLTVTDFIFLGSKITADGDCSHEIKRPLLLGRKVMTNQDNILKSRDITLPSNVHIVKVMFFPVDMCSYDSWTIKKAAVQSLSPVLLFAIPWTATLQDFLSITDSQSLLRLNSIESVMSSNHLILRWPLFLLPSIFPSIRVFSNESVLHIRCPKYWSFSFSISPSNEYSGLISLMIDGFDLLAVQGTCKSLLQYHSSKTSILWC